MYTEQCWQAYRKLEATLNSMIASQQSGAMLLVSIDNMAIIIAGYTEQEVERLMQYINGVIKNVLKTCKVKEDNVFQIQNDRLALLLNSDREQLASVADQIHEAIQKGCGLSDSVPMHVIMSMGGVVFPDQAQTVKQVMDQSYIALSSASQKMSRYFYNIEVAEKLNSEVHEKMDKARILKKAMAEKRVKLAFQPIISSKDGSVLCYEALLRILTKDNELISAGPYIGIAEEMDFIADIDFTVFSMVYEELRAADDLVLSFNVSNQTIDSQTWLEQVEAMLEGQEGVASRMIVEITETGIQRNIKRATDFVIRLQSLGCQVALDDFGAGYTSFRQLNRLPVDIVKIDGAFIKNMLNSNESHNFVRTLLDFTSSCGLKTVAEFVETGEITKELMELNVDYLQGHYFGEPTHFRPWSK